MATMPETTIRPSLIQKIKARADRGMTLMDIDHPSWYRKIIRKSLNMSVGECCIRGQLFGEYCGENDPYTTRATRWDVAHGFEASSAESNEHHIDDEYELLDYFWLEGIRARDRARKAA